MNFVRFALVGLVALVAIFAVHPDRPAHAAFFTVTNTDDSGAGSLRKAIMDANGSPGLDTIAFNIPGDGPHTISPTSALPTITGPVVIDGYTQPGASPNTNPPAAGTNAVLKIELDGTNAGVGVNGLLITAGGSTVRGLVINRFSGDAIRLGANAGNLITGNFLGTNVAGTAALGNANGVRVDQVSGNTIGGATPATRNLISGNAGHGVTLPAGSVENLVEGNLVGTDATGTTALGNGGGGSEGVGIRVGGGTARNTVRGNVVSGNVGGGINIADGAFENTVVSNLIGTNAAGTMAVGNTGASGLIIQGGAHDNLVRENLISGNLGRGLLISGPPGTAQNRVEANLIGVDITGAVRLGNFSDGVAILASDNAIGGAASGAGNIIAFNGGAGVLVEAGTKNAIQSNSIFSNLGPGIALGTIVVAPNDAGDTDKGANNLQNFPFLTSATSGSTAIEGTLNSTANTEFRLDFFSNRACDPSGFGEGESFLGATTVTTDGGGDVSFSATLASAAPVGHSVTATATDPSGNTSEFSLCINVAASPLPSPTREMLWTDIDCDGDTDSVDALKVQRYVAGLPVSQAELCPEVASDVEVTQDSTTATRMWGDADCDGDVDAIDALKKQQREVGLAVRQTEPCPDIGSTVLIPAT